MTNCSFLTLTGLVLDSQYLRFPSCLLKLSMVCRSSYSFKVITVSDVFALQAIIAEEGIYLIRLAGAPLRHITCCFSDKTAWPGSPKLISLTRKRAQGYNDINGLIRGILPLPSPQVRRNTIKFKSLLPPDTALQTERHHILRSLYTHLVQENYKNLRLNSHPKNWC